MNELSNSIYHYYLSHLDELSPQARFHFVSRIHLWSPQPETTTLLAELKDYYTNNGDSATAIAELVAAARIAPARGSAQTIALRLPYFARYPELRAYSDTLFRLLFLHTVYDIDARPLFLEHFKQAKVEQDLQALSNDLPALAVLSTPAVNFVYLYTQFIQNNSTSLDPQLLLGTEQHYDLSDKTQLQLCIYLYTHAILAESLYYSRPLPQAHQATYRQIVDRLELLISNNFERVNLDNKFEFLVTAAMVGTKPALADRIWAEAEQSLSADGTFIVDTLNDNAQYAHATLQNAEHRNVLCILAGMPYAAKI